MKDSGRDVHSVRRAKHNLTLAIRDEIKSTYSQMYFRVSHSTIVRAREQAVRDLIQAVRAVQIDAQERPKRNE